ncbi:33808_t:CDS:2, partial [Racocetra persica]
MVALVFSFVIKDIIDYFISIKSSEEEIRLGKKNQEFKVKSNLWGNLFDNSNTETKPENRSTEDSFIDDRESDDDIIL